MRNVRIRIEDLIRACRDLGEVRVVAAGSMYATLETEEEQRNKLSVSWVFD
jgi:hypothetical protein